MPPRSLLNKLLLKADQRASLQWCHTHFTQRGVVRYALQAIRESWALNLLRGDFRAFPLLVYLAHLVLHPE